MDICNPTGEKLTLYYDSVPYAFEPKAIITVQDEAGRHLISKGLRYGLVEVHFGDDPEKIRYAGLRARTDYYRTILHQHEITNQRQAELKFPPITESESVRYAKLALPVYERAIARLEEKLGAEKEAAYVADLEEILEDTTQTVPSLASATIEALRDEYRRVTGEEPEPRFNQKTLRVKIEKRRADLVAAQANAQGQPTPVVHASGSAVAPGPAPGQTPDDLLSGPLSR